MSRTSARRNTKTKCISFGKGGKGNKSRYVHLKKKDGKYVVRGASASRPARNK